MKIELNKIDCTNVKIALMIVAKQSNASESEMLQAMSLSQRFNWIEEPNQVITKELEPRKKDEKIPKSK